MPIAITDLQVTKRDMQNTGTISNPVPDDQVTLLKKQVILNPTISLWNYISFNLYYLVMIFAYVSIDTLQPTLLTDPAYYNINKSDLTDVNSTILVWDMIVKVLMAPVFGAFCDKIGRKPVVFIGITCMSIGLALCPFIGHGKVFPLFIIARGIYAVGAIACIVVPLLADYVDYETKGRAAGILVILAGLGAVMSSSYCLTWTNELSMGRRYIYLAIVVWIFGTLVCLGLKGGKYHKNLFHDAKAERAKEQLVESHILDDEHESSKEELIITNKDGEAKAEKKGFFDTIKHGIRQARNPWILLGYMVSFLSRGDTGILTFSIVIWSKHYYPSDPDSQKNAETQAYILSGIAYTMLFVAAVFFGFFGDRYSKFKSLIVIYLSTIIGIILLIMSPGPTAPLSFVSMIFIGIGVAGYQTFSLQLVSKYSSPRYRGSVNAMSSLLGVVGLIVISIGGGYLMGVNIDASFYMFMGFSALALIITSYLYIKSEILQKL